MEKETKETLMEFPCRFPLKIMGAHHPEFDIHLLEAVREHAPKTTKEDVLVKVSTKGNYMSATITITAHSQEQLDTIYRMLCAHPMVKMVL